MNRRIAVPVHIISPGAINQLTGGLAGMAKGRKVQVVVGNGQFLDPNHIEVTANDGTKKVIKFGSAIIAAGSQSSVSSARR